MEMKNVLFLICIILCGVADKGSPESQPNLEKRYAVIIDAGYTGSRVHCFEFHTNPSNGKLILDKESYKKTKPGLSSFADDPSKAAKSIKILLDEAKNLVPESEWNDTPLVFRGTAGLRLLEKEKSERLLSVVREVTAEYEFRVNEHSVEILDGITEGIFAWFSVNLLLNSSKSTQSHTAVIELGGGSTQVTFPVDPEQDAINICGRNINAFDNSGLARQSSSKSTQVTTDPQTHASYARYIRSISTFGRTFTVFANSYLGLGLSEARDAVLTKSHTSDKTILSSRCFHPQMKSKTFTFENVDYQVSEKAAPSLAGNSSEVFERCLRSVETFLVSSLKPKPLGMNGQTVIGLGSIFWVAFDSGLITDKSSGEVLVEDYRRKARDVCTNPVEDKPFLCFDLTYISALLEKGFDLPGSHKIKVFDKKGEFSFAWPLGAAYSDLTDDIKIH